MDITQQLDLDMSMPNDNTSSTTKDGEEFYSTTTTTTTSRCWGDEIPTDIMVKIFSMVPIRWLLPYKCVSKTWYFIISHHLDPNLFSVNQEQIVIQRPENRIVKPDSIDSAPLDLTISYRCTYESSCNGLICLKHYNSNCLSNGYRIIVLNPYLLEAMTLPDIINSSSSSAIPPAKQPRLMQNLQMPLYFEENYGLGFSPATNQYKVVRLTWFPKDSIDMIYRLSFRKNKSDGSITSYHRYRRPEEIKILTLGGSSSSSSSTNGEDNKCSSWRDVSSVPPHPIHGTPVYANGFLYWLVDLRNATVYSTVRGDRIVSFDVEKEKFYITSQPRILGTSIQLINVRGYLAMVHNVVRGTNVDVWVLQHLNKNNYHQQQQQQWVKEFSLKTGCFGCGVINRWEHRDIMCFVSPNNYDPKTKKKIYVGVRSGFGSTGILFELPAEENEIHGRTGILVSLKAYNMWWKWENPV